MFSFVPESVSVRQCILSQIAKMGGQGRDGKILFWHFSTTYIEHHTDSYRYFSGGKAKPLKAPKKDKKELDDDELAYKEKLRLGEWTR